MTNSDLKKIEDTLSVTLPDNYKCAVLEYPFEGLEGKFFWSLGDCANSVISGTKMYREGFARNPPWPNNLIVIGSESDESPIAMNLKSGEILKIFAGNIERPPKWVFKTFEECMDELRIDWEDKL